MLHANVQYCSIWPGAERDPYRSHLKAVKKARQTEPTKAQKLKVAKSAQRGIKRKPVQTARVGVAPGTTTMYMPYATVADLKGLGVASPTQWWRTGRPATIFHNDVSLETIRRKGVPSLRGSEGLGIASQTEWWHTGSPVSVYHKDMPLPPGTPTGAREQISPYYEGPPLHGPQSLGLVSDEINRSLSGHGPAAGLGIVPNDEELACIYGYTPVHHGWIESTKGIIESGNLGLVHQGPTQAPEKTPEQKEAEKEKRDAEMFKLQKFSLIAGGAAALGVLTLGVLNYMKNR